MSPSVGTFLVTYRTYAMDGDIFAHYSPVVNADIFHCQICCYVTMLSQENQIRMCDMSRTWSGIINFMHFEFDPGPVRLCNVAVLGLGLG